MAATQRETVALQNPAYRSTGIFELFGKQNPFGKQNLKAQRANLSGIVFFIVGKRPGVKGKPVFELTVVFFLMECRVANE